MKTHVVSIHPQAAAALGSNFAINMPGANPGDLVVVSHDSCDEHKFTAEAEKGKIRVRVRYGEIPEGLRRFEIGISQDDYKVLARMANRERTLHGKVGLPLTPEQFANSMIEHMIRGWRKVMDNNQPLPTYKND